MALFEQSFVAKLKAIERHLSDERGGFSLFALLQRFGSTAYDLVVAAPWLDETSKTDLSAITDAVQAEFTPEELTQISAVVIVRQDHSIVRFFNVMQVEHGHIEQSDNVVNDMKLRSGLLITSKRRD